MAQKDHKLKYCFNCDTDLPEMENYCPLCGQKNTDGKPSFKELVSEFLSSIFNLDSAFFNTLKHLFIPGKLTTAYFEGKRKRYTGPLRLFFVSAIIMIFFLVRFLSNAGLTDSAILGTIDKPIEPDSLSQYLHETHANQILDSLTIDSIITKIRIDQRNLDEGDFLDLDFIHDKDGKAVTFMLTDVMHMEEEELVEKYNIEGFFNVLAVHQISKIRKQPAIAIKFAISNLVWMMILMMPALAFFFKFIYIRRKKLFIEHLVFLLHSHSVIFLIYALLFSLLGIDISNTGVELKGGIAGFLPFVALGFFFIAIKFYYKQGWLKTIFKFIIILFVYNLLFSFFVVMMGLFSLIIF